MKGRMWRELLRKPQAFISFGFLLLVVLAAVTYPLWYQVDPMEQNLMGTLRPPLTDGHLIGTDQLGRDLLARVLLGARISLMVGGIALVISLVFGSLVGLLAGYFGGWIDAVITGLTETGLTGQRAAG